MPGSSQGGRVGKMDATLPPLCMAAATCAPHACCHQGGVVPGRASRSRRCSGNSSGPTGVRAAVGTAAVRLPREPFHRSVPVAPKALLPRPLSAPRSSSSSRSAGRSRALRPDSTRDRTVCAPVAIWPGNARSDHRQCAARRSGHEPPGPAANDRPANRCRACRSTCRPETAVGIPAHEPPSSAP